MPDNEVLAVGPAGERVDVPQSSAAEEKEEVQMHAMAARQIRVKD